MLKPKIAILFNEVGAQPTPDELDVIQQVQMVSWELEGIGCEVFSIPLSLENMEEVFSRLRHLEVHKVFNLTESLNRRGAWIYFAPALLESLGLPYTGAPLEAMFLTTSKILTKQKLKEHGLPTAPWYYLGAQMALEKERLYIVKPIWEDASIDIDSQSVFTGGEWPALLEKLHTSTHKRYFVEQFIDGYEVNASLLASSGGVEVLPLAMIDFSAFKEPRQRIVSYRAKWEENSFEYQNTPRSFQLPEELMRWRDGIHQISQQVWQLFGLRGYARIDFRVDPDKGPVILEINANPCLSADSGFYAAANQAGYPFREVIERILAVAE